jgi:hypothetical protein
MYGFDVHSRLWFSDIPRSYTATTKGILDDAVVQSFEDAGFAEDHRLSNLKLLLGALACAFALIAQVRFACIRKK